MSVTSMQMKRLTHTAQEHDRALSFGTDTWTSPNHKAYVAITVHFEQNAKPMCLLLDLVEVVTTDVSFWPKSGICICENTV